MSKIDPKKPFLEFTLEEDGSISAEAHNTNLPVKKCARLTLDILDEAIGANNVEVVELRPKEAPNVQRRQQQRRQQLGG